MKAALILFFGLLAGGAQAVANQITYKGITGEYTAWNEHGERISNPNEAVTILISHPTVNNLPVLAFFGEDRVDSKQRWSRTPEEAALIRGNPICQHLGFKEVTYVGRGMANHAIVTEFVVDVPVAVFNAKTSAFEKQTVKSTSEVFVGIMPGVFTFLGCIR